MSAEFDFKAYLGKAKEQVEAALDLSLIHISEPTRRS